MVSLLLILSSPVPVLSQESANEPYSYRSSFKPRVQSGYVDYLTVYAYITFRGLRPPNPPDKVLFGYALKSGDSPIPSDSSLILWADEEKLFLGAPFVKDCEYTGQIDQTQKCHTFILSAEVFSKIANARRVQIRLGHIEFDVPEGNLESYRDLANGRSPIGKKGR